MLSEKEFIQAVRQNQHIIHKVCHMYMDTQADREDLFQEIMLSAWKGIRNFRGEAKFSTWLYRVSLNTAITFFKKDLKKQDLLQKSVEDQSIADETGNEPDEQLNALNEAINELSKIDKALVMLYLEEYSYQEIADILGISANNVAVKMNRIKSRLRESSKKHLA